MPPRKTLARREPNGQPKRSLNRESAGPSPTEISRLRDAALAGMKDPIWGTQLGILHLSGKLTNSQLAAGKRWAELARDYSAAVGAPRAPRSGRLGSQWRARPPIQIGCQRRQGSPQTLPNRPSVPRRPRNPCPRQQPRQGRRGAGLRTGRPPNPDRSGRPQIWPRCPHRVLERSQTEMRPIKRGAQMLFFGLMRARKGHW